METKLCRICGRLGTTHQDIFKIEGLKHKIETCLPIFVTQFCLLPDTICVECLENVTNFYHFIKTCLQSIIVLESQYDVTESCLKSKRRHDKGCTADFTLKSKSQDTQTEDRYDIMFTKFQQDEKTKLPLIEGCDLNLVDYEIESEISDVENNVQKNQGVVVLNRKKYQKKVDEIVDDILTTKTVFAKQYFDNLENDLVSEIVQRKSIKRKSETVENLPMKICKLENNNNNRRKNKVPMKIIENKMCDSQESKDERQIMENFNEIESGELPVQIDNDSSVFQSEKMEMIFPQVCLLCQRQFSGPASLTAHIFEVHELDFNQVIENSLEKKKKIPNLLKISDVRRSNSCDETVTNEQETSCQCQTCAHLSSNKRELYAHYVSEHVDELSLLCGICCQPNTSLVNLKNHLQICSIEYPVLDRYFCSICKYSEDGMRAMENHVLVHDFLLEMCKREVRMFDPADYVEINPSCEFGPLSPTSKNLSCNLCFQSNFQSFKDFSEHRRKQHAKFHCDLCNKFYGRNSHLWKHVNRLHKNHPSVTCQLCHKTSASKYHLAQHFAKIHDKTNNDHRNIRRRHHHYHHHHQQRRFFDFRKSATSSEFEYDCGSNNAESDVTPKALDASSDLYNNIITNYTPPPNKGDFKCPKCSKRFSMKLLLKKHKKNCRPKSQKDLLTRCKTCARIFKDRQSLAKHLVNYHSEYACEICSQKKQSKCEIVSHIRFSHPNCSLFCEVCGNILRSKKDMADHLRDHADSYVCQFCGDTLQSKIKLKMHILSLHRKILSLSCGICLKLFENQHILRDHVRLTHKDELRPFTSCTVCGKNYGSKWKTYDHLNKSHGRIFRACKTCLDVFDNEKDLSEHIDVRHVKNDVKTSEMPEDSESGKEEQQEGGAVVIDEIFDNFASEMSGFSKISMLEKRLTSRGKTTVTVNNNENKSRCLEEEGAANVNVTLPQVTSGTSSSKRTVYENSDVPSMCEICFKTWPAKKHLWQHYIRCHKSVAATVCGICLKTNVDYATLQRHLRSNHPTLLHGQGYGSNFICRICGRYHNASSKLKLHMAIHENFDWDLLLETANDKEDYENMIEQVEDCSSSDDDDESETKRIKNDNSNSSDSSSSNERIEEEDEEVSTSETSNHRKETGSRSEDKTEREGDFSSEEEEEDEDSSSESEAEINEDKSLSSGGESTTTNNVNGTSSSLVNEDVVMTHSIMFGFKRGELDTAVKSISMGECEGEVKMMEEMNVEYCELPNLTSALNEREIESAVGSIL